MLATNMRSFRDVEQTGSYHPVLLDITEKVTELVRRNDEFLSSTSGAALQDQSEGFVYNPVFEAQWAPGTSINDFLVRLCKYAGCSPGAFAAFAILFDRLARKVRVTSHNVHRLMLACFTCAAKYSDDRRVSMRHYGNIAGLTLEETCAIEQEYLRLIDWDLYIPDGLAGTEHLHSLTYGLENTVGASPASSDLSVSTAMSVLTLEPQSPQSGGASPEVAPMAWGQRAPQQQFTQIQAAETNACPSMVALPMHPVAGGWTQQQACAPMCNVTQAQQAQYMTLLKQQMQYAGYMADQQQQQQQQGVAPPMVGTMAMVQQMPQPHIIHAWFAQQQMQQGTVQ